MTFGSSLTWSIEPSDSTDPSCSTVTLTPRARRRPCRARRRRRRGAVDFAQQFAVCRFPNRSCRRPVRRPAAAAAPVPTACDFSHCFARATNRRRGGRAGPSGGRSPDFLDAVAFRRRIFARPQAEPRRRSPASASSKLSHTGCGSNTVGFWNFAADPQRAIAGSSSLGQVGVGLIKRLFPCRGPGLTGNDIHHRGLAGAVRADDARISPSSSTSDSALSARNPSKLT